MSRIKIKNFGPIKEGYQKDGGWMDVKKVTVFIGNQGSGKSTIAKVISTLTWLEKWLNRYVPDNHKTLVVNFKGHFKYQRIFEYFKKNTLIEYWGEKYHITFEGTDTDAIVEIIDNYTYIVPKIMYIPSERNLTTTISEAYGLKGLSGNIFDFSEELRKAQEEMNEKYLKLPIGDYKYEYDKKTKQSFVSGTDYRINLLEASSGLQSYIPLFLVSRHLSMPTPNDEETFKKNINVNDLMKLNREIQDIELNDLKKDKDEIIAKIKARFYNKCFINIAEEPEQNLFPDSQRIVLYSLLEYNNRNKGNKLIITTHSPYLINYLTLCVKAENVYKLLKEKKYKLSDPEYTYINDIVPMSSTVKSKDLVIYELDEKDGIITKLGSFEGIPSDNNFLNKSLGNGNQLFDSLLEIEEEL